MRLKNLSEAVERFLDTQRPAIRETVQLFSQQSMVQLTSPPVPGSELDLPKPVSMQLIDDQQLELSLMTIYFFNPMN